MAKHYHVTVNTPGYLPESEPSYFTNRRDAEKAATAIKNEILDDNWLVENVHNVATGNARNGIYIVDTNREHDLGTAIEVYECQEADCDQEM